MSDLKLACEGSDIKPKATLPEQASLWEHFPLFHEEGGSWRPFGIEVQPSHLWDINSMVHKAAKDCGLFLPENCKDLEVFCQLEDWTRRLRRRFTVNSDLQARVTETMQLVDEAKKPKKQAASLGQLPMTNDQLRQRLIQHDAEKSVLKYLLAVACEVDEIYGRCAWGTHRTTQSERTAMKTDKDHPCPAGIPQLDKHDPCHGGRPQPDKHDPCNGGKPQPEMFVHVTQYMVVHLLGVTRLPNVGERRQCVKLYPVTDEIEPSEVTCEPAMELTSSVRFSLRPNRTPFTLLVGNVKKETASKGPPKTNDDVLQHCENAVHQHLAELLVCMRSSLFARNWRYMDPTKAQKTRPAERNYIFGFIQNNTRIQLTCLCLTRKHMFKIMKRLRSVHIDSADDFHSNTEPPPDDCRSSTEPSPTSSQVFGANDSDGQSAISRVKVKQLTDCLASHLENDGHKKNGGQEENDGQEREEPGVLYISNCVDLVQGLFTNDFCANEGYEQVVKYFGILGQYMDIIKTAEGDVKKGEDDEYRDDCSFS